MPTRIDHACSLPEEARSWFEDAVLPFAETLTKAKLERKARTVRERAHPESIDTRTETAFEKRFVEVEPTRDGMAYLTAYLPAADAIGIHNRLTDMAIALQGKTESRTLTQLRTDLLTRLLEDGMLPDSGSRKLNGIRPTVHITVPVLSLLGHSDEPATLEGYGPISIDTARQLAAHAPYFYRILTHPETGTVLSVGRERYTASKELRRYLRYRDGTCRFPGCNRAARRSDLDHTKAWEHNGYTEHNNLAHLCPMHHHLKHNTGWTVIQLDDGILEWTSPSGRHYTTYPENPIAGSLNT
jgi:hypothetical protein